MRRRRRKSHWTLRDLRWVWGWDREGRCVFVAADNGKTDELVGDLRREKALLDLWMLAADERWVLVVVGHGRNKELDGSKFFGKRRRNSKEDASVSLTDLVESASVVGVDEVSVVDHLRSQYEDRADGRGAYVEVLQVFYHLGSLQTTDSLDAVRGWHKGIDRRSDQVDDLARELCDSQRILLDPSSPHCWEPFKLVNCRGL